MSKERASNQYFSSSTISAPSGTDISSKDSIAESIQRLMAAGASTNSAPSSVADVSSVPSATALPPRLPTPLGSSARGATTSLARSGEGYDRGELSGKLTESVVSATYVDENSCRAMVGKIEGAFCVEPNCTVNAHQWRKSKAAPTEPSYHICEKIKGKWMAYDTPSLLAKDIPADSIAILEEEKMPKTQWEELFRNIQDEIDAKNHPAEVYVKEEIKGVPEDLDISTEFEEIKAPRPMPEFDPSLDPASWSSIFKDNISCMNDLVKAMESVNIQFEQNQMDKVEVVEHYRTLAVKLNEVVKNLGDPTSLLVRHQDFATAFMALERQQSNLEIENEDLKMEFTENKEMLTEQMDSLKLEVKTEVAKAHSPSQVSTTTVTSASVLSALNGVVFDQNGRMLSGMPTDVDGEIVSLREMWLASKASAQECKQMQVRLQNLEKEVIDLREQTKDMDARIEASGGVKVGDIHFASKEDLRKQVLIDCPLGKGIRCFPTHSSIVVHNSVASAKDRSHYRNINKDLTPTEVMVIDAAKSDQCPPYTGTNKSYEADTKLPCLKSTKTWKGIGGLGKQQEIDRLLFNCVNKVKAAIDQDLTPGTEMYKFAETMNHLVGKWHGELHKLFNDQEQVLSSLNLPEDDILKLISEMFRLIFQYLHSETTIIHEAADIDVDPIDRLTNLVWASAKVHMRMDEFIKAEFLHHSIVQSAYNYFFTKKMGSSKAAADMATKVTSLEKDLKGNTAEVAKLKNELKEATKGMKDKFDHWKKQNQNK